MNALLPIIRRKRRPLVPIEAAPVTGPANPPRPAVLPVAPPSVPAEGPSQGREAKRVRGQSTPPARRAGKAVS
jgi:hypothetical protein